MEEKLQKNLCPNHHNSDEMVDKERARLLLYIFNKLASLEATLVETTTHPLTDGGEV